jgi:hypothetical protein
LQGYLPENETRDSGGFLSGVSMSEGWRIGFNLSHRLPVVNLFATLRTLVVFQIRDCIGFSLEPVDPVFTNFPDSVAAAGWADGDLDHGDYSCCRDLFEETKKKYLSDPASLTSLPFV